MRWIDHKQAAGETLDYGWDWAGYWPDSDSIVSSSWSVSAFSAADGALPTIDSHSNDVSTTTVWIVGGTVDAWITNTVSTAAGRTAERSFLLRSVTRRQEAV
jgi:hypothetical protein